MADPKAVVPIGVVRDRVIQRLTEAFANDVLTVAELEDRLEKVYRATTPAEIDALVAGLPATRPATEPAELAGDVPAPRMERILSIFSSQTRRGLWSVPRNLRLFALFSDTTVDLTQASVPRDIIEMHVNVTFANLVIVVPPGMRVVNRVGAFAANVESEAALDLAPMLPGSPVVRITGTAVFANLEIVSGPKPTE